MTNPGMTSPFTADLMDAAAALKHLRQIMGTSQKQMAKENVKKYATQRVKAAEESQAKLEEAAAKLKDAAAKEDIGHQAQQMMAQMQGLVTAMSAAQASVKQSIGA